MEYHRTSPHTGVDEFKCDKLIVSMFRKVTKNLFLQETFALLNELNDL